MRPLLLAGCLSSVLAAAAVADPATAPRTADTAAAATPAAPKTPKKVTSPAPAKPASKAGTRKSPAEIRKVSDTYLKQCLRDWDAATHMTRTEWQRTCRRLARARVQFMLEGLDE